MLGGGPEVSRADLSLDELLLDADALHVAEVLLLDWLHHLVVKGTGQMRVAVEQVLV